MENEKMEQAARHAAEIEDNIGDRIFWKDRARRIARLIEIDEEVAIKKMQQLVFNEQQERRKQGARDLARLLFCILVYICNMDERTALAYCALVDAGDGGGCRPMGLGL